MAASESSQWTVIVVMQQYSKFTGTFSLSPNTTLSEVMQLYKDMFNLFEHLNFVSANEDMIYDDESLTLHRIGETAPRMVYLRAEIRNEPLSVSESDIFVYLNDKCNHHLIKPYEKLYKLTGQISGSPKSWECNHLPLDLNLTVKQAGLGNKSVIYESVSSIKVKLSSKETVVIQMPSNCLVLHLREEVIRYEAGDFSLKHLGSYLRSDDTVACLKHEVEVVKSEFVVNFDNQCVTWWTKDEPITFSEFIFQLSVKGDIDTQKLETFTFVCIGCQRRICHSEDYAPLLPVECCKERSLTLKAMTTSNTESRSDSNDIAKSIQIFQEHLMRCRVKGSQRESSRRVCRRLQKEFTTEKLDYNTFTQCNEKLLISMDELKRKIKKLEFDIKDLRTKNIELEREIARSFSTDMAGTEETEISKQRVKLLKSEEIKPKDRRWSLSRMKSSPGALEFKPSRLSEKPSAGVGVELLVFYKLGVYHPLSVSMMQICGHYSWSDPYVKCKIAKIDPGWTTFKDLRSIMKKLFSGREIQVIRQCRGFVDTKAVSEVTDRDDDEAVRPDMSPHMNNSPYCDENGVQYSYEQAGQPRWKYISKGGYIFIGGGGRRTVLAIN